MFSRTSLNAILAATIASSLLFSLFLSAQGRNSSIGKEKSIILWVREVKGQPIYWVNDKAAGRAPLSGLVAVLGSHESVSLTVILDSHVPIQEMGEIGGMLEKIPIKNARYYVYDPSAATGMSEIIWKSQILPLPKLPPK